jgi:hypothetical protein
MHSFVLFRLVWYQGIMTAGCIRDINPLNTEIILHDIQFVPRRERHVLRLVRLVGDGSAGKWLFVVRSVLDT